MVNERYRFYGMNQDDFYHNPGGARRPIPHIPQPQDDDSIYFVKIDKDDTSANYLKYKLSGDEGILIDEISSSDGSKLLLFKLVGGENRDYSAGQYIAIDNENRIISVSGLEDVYLTKSDASGTYALKGCIDRVEDEISNLIHSGLHYWNPSYELLSSNSAAWNKAIEGNVYYEGPYISIYKTPNGLNYISASGLTPYVEFEKISGDLYVLSGEQKEFHEQCHSELQAISGVVWDIYSSCSGFPSSVSASFSSLVTSYNAFSADVSQKVYEISGKIPIVSGDGNIIVNSAYDDVTNTTTYTISSKIEGAVNYLEGDNIQFVKTEGGVLINATGLVKNELYNPWSSKIEQDLVNASSYTKNVEDYSHNVSSYINSKYEYWDSVSSKMDGKFLTSWSAKVENSASDLNNKIKGLSGEFASYSANKTLTDETLNNSAKNLKNEIDTKLYTSSFNTWSGNYDTLINGKFSYVSGKIDEVSGIIKDNSAKWEKDTTYSAGNLIEIDKNNYINVISGDNGVALSGDVTNITDTLKSTITNVSSTLNTKIEGLSGEFASYSANKTLTDDVLKTSANNLNKKINVVSGDLNIVSGFIQSHSASWDVDHVYSAGKGIDIVDKGNHYEINTSGVIYQTNFDSYSSNVKTYIDKVSSNTDTISSFVETHSADWNKGDNYEITSLTPNYVSAWKTKTEDGYLLNISSKPNGGGANYEAGDWIDSDKLNDNVISVSGWKAFHVQDPLYFELYDTSANLCIDLSKIVVDPKSTIILNGYNVTTSNNFITATSPNDMYGEWEFEFNKAMVVNLCINATFVPDSEKYYDSYSEVGFIGTDVSNPIKYTMIGYAPQSFNTSTITTIDVPDRGTTKIQFKLYLGDEGDDFITEVKQPCITIQEM